MNPSIDTAQAASAEGARHSLILLAAGSGSRTGYATPKQFLLLAGKPIIMHTLERVEMVEAIADIIVVAQPEHHAFIQGYVDSYKLKKPVKLVAGGATRHASVHQGLQACSSSSVLIHEAARPFVKTEDFITIAREAHPNVTFGLEIPFTVLEQKDGFVSGLLRRPDLINVQLPQKFDKAALLEAHDLAIRDRLDFTEDASLLCHYQLGKVKVIPGRDQNIKITTASDVVLSDNIYKDFLGIEK